jgi:hypothetical protein
MRHFFVRFLFLVLIISLILPPNAYAYFDPGAGSYLLQIAAAALFAGIFIISNWWKRIKSIFIKLFKIDDGNKTEKAGGK